MAGHSTGAPVVNVYHEKSMILPDVSRVLACLYEKHVKFETHRASYKDILGLQASTQVPVPFYHGSTFLQDSRVICRYIAENYEHQGYPYLLGKDVLERASIEQWLRHEEHAFDPPSRALFCHLAFPVDREDNDDDIDTEKQKLEEVLEVYEQRLGDSEFLAGNKFTLADLFHIPNTHHIVTSDKFAYLYDSRKNVQRWWNAISARRSWQQVLRDMKTLEEQLKLEELEQQQQWYSEPHPTPVVRTVWIDSRKQTATQPQKVQVPPPSTSTISASSSALQAVKPRPAEKSRAPKETPSSSSQSTTTTQKPPTSVQETPSSKFLPPATSPTPDKMPPRTDTGKPSSSEQRPRPSKEAPDKVHVSGVYEASSHTDEAEPYTKPSPQEASQTNDKTPETDDTSDVATSPKSSPRPAKEASNKLRPNDFYGDESNFANVDSQVDKPVPYTEPTPQKPAETPYPGPPQQKAEMGEKLSDRRSAVQRPYEQQHAEQANMTSADQRAASPPPKHVAADDARGAQDTAKEAREANQRRSTSASPRKLSSYAQNAHKQSKVSPIDLKAPGPSPMQANAEDTQDFMSEDERFSTKKLRKMLEEAESTTPKPQLTDSHGPAEEEKMPPIQPKKTSDAQAGREQARAISADKKEGGSPSTRARALEALDTEKKARGTDEFAKTLGVDQRAPSTVPTHMPTDARQASAPVQEAAPNSREIRDDGFDKNSPVYQRVQEKTPRQPPPSDARRPSASILEATRDARGPGDDELVKTSTTDQRATLPTSKQAPTFEAHRDLTPSQGAIPDVHDAGDDMPKTPVVDKRAAPPRPTQASVSDSQHATEPIKGAAPTAHGIPDDETAKTSKVDQSAKKYGPVQAPASDGHSASTATRGDIPNTRSNNVAVRPSTADQKGTLPATPSPPAPDTRRGTVPDQGSTQYPKPHSFEDPRNKTALAEAGQPNMTVADKHLGGQIPKNAGALSAEHPQLKSQENMKATYAYKQLPGDQSKDQLAENNKMKGDDAVPATKSGKAKEGNFLASANEKNTAQTQATSIDEPSKLQGQPEQSKAQSSKDIGKQTNDTASSRSSSASKETLPSGPEKSVSEQQQADQFNVQSPQDNMKQGEETVVLGYGIELPKERDANTNQKSSEKMQAEASHKSEEQTSSGTRQSNNNRNNNKTDGSNKGL